jgi:hypothetical protein
MLARTNKKWFKKAEDLIFTQARMINVSSKWDKDPLAAPKHGPVQDADAEPRFLEMVKMHFDKAAKFTNVSDDLLKYIKE